MVTSQSSVAEEHLRRIQTVTDAGLAHLTVEALLDELLSRIRELLHADTAAVLLLDENHNELVATAAKGIEEEVEQGVRLPVGAGFAGRIAANGQPVILERVDHGKVLNPLLLRRGIRSMLGVPLTTGDGVIGVLHVGTLYPRRFTEEDVELLQLVADRVALAVEAGRQHEHRVIAETLQRSLLPDRFPHLEGVEIAGHYQPAHGGMVGGDWYDVFLLGLESLYVVVGDVAGRGLPAAVAMARLRSAVRAMALVEETPGGIISRVNDFLLQFDQGVMATMLVGVLTPDGTVRYASAGHMPPLVVDRQNRARLIEEVAEPPLGGSSSGRYRDRTLTLDAGSSLVLYTDGLVERRGFPLDEGLEALCRAVETPWINLDSLCARVFQPEPQLADDLALLTLRYTGSHPTETLHATIDADLRELGPLRRKLGRWLSSCGADEQQAQDVLVAVGEATANAIEHAHGPGRGTVEVDALASGGMLEIRIRDRGAWREARGTDRGLGRSLMAALMDEVTFESREDGTIVTMRKRLTA